LKELDTCTAGGTGGTKVATSVSGEFARAPAGVAFVPV
jgi:hypothetical protein